MGVYVCVREFPGGWKSLVGARGWCGEGGRLKAEMGWAVDWEGFEGDCLA